MRKNNFFLVVVMMFAYTSLAGQTADHKFSMSVNAINTNYNGDYGSGIWSFQHIYPGWGLSFGMYYNPSFDLILQGSSGSYGFVMDNENAFKINKFDMKLLGRVKFNNGYLLEETSKYSPFVTLGVGFASYSPRVAGYPDRVTEGMDFIVPIGAGLKYQFTDGLAFQYQYLYNFTNKDQRDENRNRSPSTTPIYDSKPGNDAFGEHVLSLVYTFGTATNKAFVANSMDKIRTTFAGKKVKEKTRPVIVNKEELKDKADNLPNKTVQLAKVIKEKEKEKDRVVHANWYAIGSKKELKEEKIITSDGWFCPGRILENNFNKNYFESIDAEKTTSICLYSSKAKILTTHPKSSYLLEKGKETLTLLITDTKEFWSISNYLVIEVN